MLLDLCENAGSATLKVNCMCDVQMLRRSLVMMRSQMERAFRNLSRRPRRARWFRVDAPGGAPSLQTSSPPLQTLVHCTLIPTQAETSHPFV